MLHLGEQELLGDLRLPIHQGEVGCAPLQSLSQHLLRYLQHHQGVCKKVGRCHPPHSHRRGQANRVVAQAGAGEVRPGLRQLHLVEQGSHLTAVKGCFQLSLRRDSLGQYTNGLVQPVLNGIFQRKQTLIGLRRMCSAHWDQIGLKTTFRSIPLANHVEKLPRVGRGLCRIGAGQIHTLHRHVLVAGKEQIEVQLPGNSAGDILSAV